MFFLDAVRPHPCGFRLAYLLMSASIVVLEVVFHAFAAPLGIRDVLILAVLCVLLSVAPWLGFAGDLLYVAVFAENGSMALRELSRRAVDVALLDVDMPVLDGLAAAKEMARLYPSVVVVMLTVFEHEESLARSLALNVRGFLTKDISSAQLAQLIKQAHAGYSVFGPRPTSILADSYLNSGKNDPKYDAFRERVERLPGYLRTTFDLLIQALPNKTIAKRLGLSEATVRSYISEIFTTLGYTNRGELTITAIKAGY